MKSRRDFVNTVGFIGLGLMGRGMARCLIRAGYTVRLYNRTRSRAEEVATLGGTVADSPAEAADGADAVVTMVADPAALIDIIEGKYGVLATIRPGTILIDSSTVSPPATLRAAGKLREKGASMLDAPVFGSKNEAEKGDLGFMVGGDPETLEHARPLFEAMGKSVRHIGPSGMGSYAKLVFNLVVSVTLEAFSEGMALATRAGIDPALMFEILQSARARSGIAEMKGPQILKRDFTPFFPLRLMNKDLQLALETAHALGVPMPALAATQQVFLASLADGRGDEDFSTIIKHFEKATGIEVAPGKERPR
jgi:3-hydroxyisobutyrate dehydrogenase